MNLLRPQPELNLQKACYQGKHYLYKMCFYNVLEKIQVSLEFPKDPTKIPKIPQD